MARQFNPLRGYFDREEEDEYNEGPKTPRCKRCHSEEVRWRQQGGRWVLFSLTPGVLHTCDIEAYFEEV